MPLIASIDLSVSLFFHSIQFVALTVERDEPDWSVNVKKAAASIVQLDVTGVRSAPDGGVFGERSSSINSLEVIRPHNEITRHSLSTRYAVITKKDAVTGDCLTNLRFTRLPYHRAVRQLATDEGDRVAVELCRSSNIYEIVKTKDFDDCRVDPLHSSSTSGGQWHQVRD